MKVLVTNAVPLNGGDEAILRAAVHSITRRWPAARVTVLCRNVTQCRRLLPDLALDADLDAPPDSPRSRFFHRFFPGVVRRSIERHYRECDLVISAPGGFLHDFYPIEARLRGFEFALSLGKPLVIFAQSLGPFWKEESIRRIREVLAKVTRICVRDAISRQHLLDCGVADERIVPAGDAAFLWHALAPDLFREKSGPTRLIGLSFREWPLADAASVQRIIGKAVALCRHLLGDSSVRLRFLSTCQGLPGYVDDSALALRIVAELPAEFRERCEIDRARYAPRELISALGACDAFIAMRLHACVLAMLGGTPAFGLGYEDKTEGIFTQLGFARWQRRFETDSAEWMAGATEFLANQPTIRAALKPALAGAVLLAERNLEAVATALPNP